jgi:hypothetical protein
VKIYGIRESWDYETYDLIEFFGTLEDAETRVAELNQNKSSVQLDLSSYNGYTVEEVIVK